jgi:uncharacterized protein
MLGAARRASTLRNRFRLMRARLPRPTYWETVALQSGSRVLDARFVPGRQGMPAVLVCHGIGDTLDMWDGIQALFEERGIGSMVFSYSGYGKSTGRVRARYYDEDFLVAYDELLRRVEAGTPNFVLGYSLGTGIAASGVRNSGKMPAGLFLCSGFTSLREAGLEIGFPHWLTRCVPDVWHTTGSLAEGEVPVVVVHSDRDRLFSMKTAEQLAATEGFELIAAHGFSHSAPLFQVAEEYWSPVAERMLQLQAVCERVAQSDL